MSDEASGYGERIQGREMVRRAGAGRRVASQGETIDEALANLQEALALHFEPSVSTAASR